MFLVQQPMQTISKECVSLPALRIPHSLRKQEQELCISLTMNNFSSSRDPGIPKGYLVTHAKKPTLEQSNCFLLMGEAEGVLVKD